MAYHHLITPLILLLLLITYPGRFISAQERTFSIEAGHVQWSRDLDNAFGQSKISGKPIFVLFQEIPGCIGCKTFGKEVLSQPLLVEAIESEFHPVLIYNNRLGGKDEEWLNFFKEPSWNYQVIRFLNSEGEDIIPRKDKVWDIHGVVARMNLALAASGKEIPPYLNTLRLEFDLQNHDQVGLAMACFWTGENILGKIDGVIKTEAGWYNNREITLVTYHRKAIDLQKILEQARKSDCAQEVYLPNRQYTAIKQFPSRTLNFNNYVKAEISDQKRHLQRYPQFTAITNLTEMQQTKLNAFLPGDMHLALRWLSPRQQAIVKEHSNVD